MGRMKDLLIDLQNNYFELNIAKKLGISLEDLMRLEWDVVEADDEGRGGYWIQFAKKSPKTILAKILNLVDDYRVYFDSEKFLMAYSYNELFETITSDQDYTKRYKDEMINLESLLSIKTDNNQKKILYRQIFIGVISIMETFLSDAFINIIYKNKKYFRKFVETSPEFKNVKIELSEIYKKTEQLDDIGKKIMLDTIYHNLGKVMPMYQNTFSISFPNIGEISKYVSVRHDLVHRNGKTKEGEPVIIKKKTIEKLICDINTFVDLLVNELKAIK